MDIEFLVSAYQAHQYPPADKPEIAFAGRSNVGKSSLLNALVNRRSLARTSAKPGRTQALNFFCLNKNLYLVDLPGYGYAKVPLEVKKSWGKMVEHYLKVRSNLKAVVLIFDIRRDPGEEDWNLIHWFNQYHIPVITALTKADKLSRQQALARRKVLYGQIKEISAIEPTLCSAKTKEGLQELWMKIRKETAESVNNRLEAE
jgi:GTP-binding protein